jgi:hypothetical protein
VPALFANHLECKFNLSLSQDDADAEEGSRFSATLHGLAGGLDQGHAAIPTCQRQPDLGFEFLRLKAVVDCLQISTTFKECK